MKLEDCIKKNKAAFSDEIPLQGHMNRFDVRLKQFTNHTRTYHLIKRTALSVSAIIIVLLGIGYLCWHPTKPISHNHTVLLTKFDVSSEIVAKDTNMQQQPSTQNILPSTNSFHTTTKTSVPFSQQSKLTKDSTWNISYIEKQYHCKLEEEIIHLQQIIAQSNEETRQYIEKDIDEIRLSSQIPPSYQNLSDEEQLHLITQIYKTQIESIQRIQENLKEITYYQ